MDVIFIAACAVLSVLSALVSLQAARNARADLESLDRRLHLLESSTRSLQDSATSQAETLEQLANRVKMQRVRNAVNHAARDNDEPDPYRDPNAWRQAMNKRLAFGSNLRKPK